jgi:predicted phage-related endonuclease
MTITYHSVIQGSEEWHALRCGMLTASEMKLILTPTLKIAANDKQRAHFYELLAQRVSGYVEPSYVSDDMLRGVEDEISARDLYAAKYAPVKEVGFVTNDEWGFTLGCSPDALVGEDGMLECKSRRQRFQIETILSGEMPDDYKLQVQTALLVTGRKWVDFISYSGGLPMLTVRVLPDPIVQDAIIAAATKFEADLVAADKQFASALVSGLRLQPTERKIVQEMFV